jgi:hypothetical protein
MMDFFSSLSRQDLLWGLPSLLPNEYRPGRGAISPEVKWPEREANPCPPSSAEFKNAWSYTSITQHVFVLWCLIKQ